MTPASCDTDVGQAMDKESREPTSRDSGASLIIALVFLLVIGLVVTALARFAVGSMTNTVNLTATQSRGANAETAATVAIQQVRVQYSFQGLAYGAGSFGAASWCEPSWVKSQYSMQAACAGEVNPGSHSTRIVGFYVCPSTVSTAATCATSSSQQVMYAEAVFDDLPSGSNPTDTCTSSGSGSTCGLLMHIEQWDVRLADK